MRITWKHGQMLPTFDYTITVLNKLAAKDSATKLDVWKSTVLHNCSWKSLSERNVSGNTASVGGVFVVRIPKSKDYHEYREWKENMEGFTLSTGDYVIKGEVMEEITPNTIIDVVNSYKPDAFIIKTAQNNAETIELAEHYHIEGV